MSVQFRQATKNDLPQLKELAVRSWSQFQPILTPENWKRLLANLTNEATYTELFEHSTCFVAATDDHTIVGMAFLVPHGHPTDIYDKDWCYIRYVTVDPTFGGKGIGRRLTTLCVDTARQNNERVIALHTSEFMDTARHIYESIGFRILKEIDQRQGKRYWLYALRLTDEIEK